MATPGVDDPELARLLRALLSARLRDRVAELGEKLDGELLGSLYRAASLPTEVIRAELRAEGLEHWDPEGGQQPTRSGLDRSSRRLIARAARLAGLRGAAGGLGGWMTLAPDLGLALVHSLRLGQRLAVVWGLDPEREEGRLWLSRSLAEAWQVHLPREGLQATSLHQVPGLVRAQLEQGVGAGGALARTLAGRAAWLAGRRVLRVVPGLGAGVSAWAARRQILAQGEAMVASLAARWELRGAGEGRILEAVEVR